METFDVDDDQFVYVYTNWCAKHNGREFNNRNYGQGEYYDDNKVNIHLNMKLHQLSFSVDNVDQGIAFDNIKTGKDIEYRLMVSLYYVGATVEILKFYSK